MPPKTLNITSYEITFIAYMKLAKSIQYKHVICKQMPNDKTLKVLQVDRSDDRCDNGK